MAWTIAESWAAATEVVALAYGVDLTAVRAPSQGRGPRPPGPVRTPKKVAVHLTALVSGADYAAIGRHLGLHKDTVSSHCADGRAGAWEDEAEVLSETLERMVRAKLTLTAPPAVLPGRRGLVAFELRRLSEQLSLAAQRLSDEGAASSDRHPTACASRRIAA